MWADLRIRGFLEQVTLLRRTQRAAESTLPLRSGILVFDINTHALLGRLAVGLGSNYFNYPQNLVRFGTDGLAFITSTGQVYLVDISTIPLLATPIRNSSRGHLPG